MQTNNIGANIASVMDEVERHVKRLKKPDVPNVERGFEVSYQACRQQQLVAMTPWMKNALFKFGDLSEGKRLMVDDPPTKAEKVINEEVTKWLNKVNGTKVLEYDHSLPLLDKRHYDVDCYHNHKENMRDIQPGQEKQRLDGFRVFMRKPTIQGFKELLLSDPVFRRAVDYVLSQMPDVVATSEPEVYSQPFQRKDTNVSAFWWQNDRNIDPQSGKTYGQLAIDEANKINNTDDALRYNVDTAYGRNQRGKGRALIASSRVLNVYLNQIEAPEIQAVKERVPAFVGYNDDRVLKDSLSSMADFCIANKLHAANWDQTAYDQHIPSDLLNLIGAMRELKANGSKAKKLARLRTVCAMRSWLVNGLTNEIEEIFGRIFSGYIDTNLGGGWANLLITTYVLMLIDSKYLQKVAIPMRGAHAKVMGDDILAAYDPETFKPQEMVKQMDRLGMEMNLSKEAFGIFFLQYRLFEYEGERVMVYPWTRVLKSLLFKENSVGLGPGGWTMMLYQQLSKLVPYKPALEAVVQILKPYDNMNLGTKLTISELITMVQAEDAEVEGKRAQKTSTILNDGDPSKQRMFNGAEYNSEFLTAVRDAVVSVY